MSNLQIIPPTHAALTCTLGEEWFAAVPEQHLNWSTGQPVYCPGGQKGCSGTLRRLQILEGPLASGPGLCVVILGGNEREEKLGWFFPNVFLTHKS